MRCRSVVLILLICLLPACNMPTQARLTTPLTTQTPLRINQTATPGQGSPIAATNWLTATTGVLSYTIQNGTPAASPNFLHPDLQCKYLGVAGQVFGRDRVPLVGMPVQVNGALNGQPVLRLAITGAVSSLGQGGYEINLGNQPLASQNSLYILLYDVNGHVLSDKIYFNTYASCQQNLLIINFVQKSPANLHDYLPLLPQGLHGSTNYVPAVPNRVP